MSLICIYQVNAQRNTSKKRSVIVLVNIGKGRGKKGAIERISYVDIDCESEICKLAEYGQIAASKAIISLATGDFESGNQWMFASYYYDRFLAGKV